METRKNTTKVNTNGEKDTCCVVCKSEENVVNFKGKNICKHCIAEAIAM